MKEHDRTAVVAPSFALYGLYSPDPGIDGAAFHLAKATTPVGRAPGPDPALRVADGEMSKVHAHVAWSPERRRFVLEDQRSSNGTSLNGRPTEREVLAAGDVIRMGGTVFRFDVYDDDAVGWRSRPGAALVARSGSMRRVVQRVAQAAQSRITVLIVGETGTGKELVADALHGASGRTGPLRAVNCAALPTDLVESELFGHVKGAFSGADAAATGLFRDADGGTLFLDEIGELAPDIQAKLLRVLETRRVRPVGGTTEYSVDVRVVAATNRPLESDAEAGRFRDDLYARLAEWTIALDPLRERPMDLAPLWRHFAATYAPGATLTLKGSAFEALALYSWPYNARELLAVVKGVALAPPLDGRVSLRHLPPEIAGRVLRRAGDLTPTPEPVVPTGEIPTSRQLRQEMTRHGGDVIAVAAALGKPEALVRRWLRRYHIDPAAYAR